MLLTMAKIEIIGPKKYFYQALALLHQLGTVHLDDVSQQKENIFMRSMDIDEEASKSKSELRDLITRLHGIMSSIEPAKVDKSRQNGDTYWKADAEELSKEAEKLVGQLEEKARSIANKKTDMEFELAQLDRYQDVMKKIHPLAKKIVTLEGSETVAFLLEGDFRDTVNIINTEIGKITNGKHELISTPIDEETTAAIVVFNKKYSKKIHNFLTDKVSEIRLPSSLKDLSIDKVLDEIDSKKVSMPVEIKGFGKQLNKMSEEWYYKLHDLTTAMSNKIEEIKKIPTMGETDYTFVMQGWLPYKKLKNTQKELQRNFGNRVLVKQLELSPHELENAPVVIENPAWAKPFELIFNVWQPPRYGTVDPTKFLAIFFPLFFGYILGDIGYGLIVLLMSTFLKKKFAKQNDMIWASTTIFQIAGAAAIFFGIIYGEAFGNLLEKYVFYELKGGAEAYHHHPYMFKLGALKWPYHRDITIEGRIMDFIVLTLGLGFIHLAVSISLGIVNAVKEKSQKHMIEKIGLLAILFAAIGIIMAGRGASFLSTPSYIIIFAGIIAVGYGAGPFGAMEHIFGLIGNLFSYLRLMAIGLAGAILGAVSNELAIKFAEMGAAGLVIGLALAVMLHSINIIVHTFSPTIHAIRLNVLEGFGKFYESGGKIYKPFKARR